MADPNPQILMTTNKGEMLLELFEDIAPNTVANFVSLVESGFYNGIKFHRVVADFVIQAGCPFSKEPGKGHPGTGGPGYCIDCEVSKSNIPVKHGAKYLSMAHAGPNTGGSQFFITHRATPHLDGVHTVFGKVVTGAEIVDTIAEGDTITSCVVQSKRGHAYVPRKNNIRR